MIIAGLITIAKHSKAAQLDINISFIVFQFLSRFHRVEFTFIGKVFIVIFWMSYPLASIGKLGTEKMDIVAGGGKYGSFAADFLRRKARSFAVVDINPSCLAAREFTLKSATRIEREGEYFVRGDLSTVLDLLATVNAEFVFPTVPTHLAADLARIKFSLQPWIERIDNVLPYMPQTVVVKADEGSLVATFNKGHKCLDKCSMPEVCPSSGFKKPCTMTELMRSAAPDAFFLLSHSMAPGLGALKVVNLTQFLDYAKKKRRFVVATTCDCHGVLTAMRKCDSESGV